MYCVLLIWPLFMYDTQLEKYPNSLSWIAEREPQPKKSRSGILWRQCLCVVLAYTMFIEPGLLHRAAEAGFNPSTDIVRTYARETTFTYNEMHQQTGRTLPDGRSERGFCEHRAPGTQ